MPKAKYGCQLPQDINDFDRAIETAKLCENLGYDSVWFYDHLSPYWLRSGQAFECWTALSAVAARTTTIKLGTLVTNVGFRNPSLLAKMSSTVDNISGGRLILGLGIGDALSRSELRSYGFEFPSLKARVARLRETVLVLKAMWTKDKATFHGEHYKIRNAVNKPKPIQTPHPPIWIGGKHSEILDVVAEFADGWNYWGLNANELKRRTHWLSERCIKYGRSPKCILKSWLGTFPEQSSNMKAYSGLVQSISAKLKNQTDAGTRYFIASFPSSSGTKIYEAFAEAVKNLA